MLGGISNTDGKFESSLDNVSEELAWVKKQIQRELTDLQKDVQEDQVKKSFFEKKEDKIVYNMDLVKRYLSSCVQKEDFQINSAVVMAVQISLESKGYDVGAIDGLLKKSSGKESDTKKIIKKFQKENGLRVDGVPGKNTVKKILELLGNISSTPEKIEKNNPKGNDDLEKELKKLDIKQDDLVKLFALEIYRGRVMSDNEIEAKGYDSKVVRDLVKNKEEMEKLDKIMPKNLKHEQVTKVLEIDNEVDDNQEKPEEKPVETKEDNNQKESWETADILIGPKLKATNRKELGGIGSSIMYGFQGYGMRSFGFSNMAGKNSGKADGSRFEEENGKLKETFILPRSELIDYCKNHNIKSFMFYFGGNEKSEVERQKALENIEKWGEYLEKGGIQPVLATCIGEDISQHKDSTGKAYVKEYNAAIKDMQQRHPTRSLIDFVKIDQPDIFRPNDGWHPGDTGYKRMGTKIEQCFSVAEK